MAAACYQKSLARSEYCMAFLWAAENDTLGLARIKRLWNERHVQNGVSWINLLTFYMGCLLMDFGSNRKSGNINQYFVYLSN
jgi:hypothetical protein